MENIEDQRKRKLYNILSAVKLGSLLFGVILFLNQFFTQRQIPLNEVTTYANIWTISFFAIFFAFIYFLWLLLSAKYSQFKHLKTLRILENFVYITLYSFLALASSAYDNEYKILFIFVIIISTLQLGLNYGMGVAIFSSLLLLVMDALHAPSAVINIPFEKDLIMSGVFLSTAGVLGHYVKIENENINRKNRHLEELSREILEKDKQHRYLEQILFNNEICYNLLFQNSRDAILVHRDFKVIYANESASKLMGFSAPSELIGKSFLDYASCHSDRNIHNIIHKLTDESVNTATLECKLPQEDGSITIMKNTSTKFLYEGKPTILSILHDITSDKQVERLKKDVAKNIELLNETREFNRLITEFFSNISHELKTPLNVIYSAVQVLALKNNMNDGNFASYHDKYLKIMKQNCFRLMRLINNLLDLTKLDSGFLKLNLENHNIVSVVEDISQSVVSYLESKEIKFVFDTDTEEKIMAIDPDKIERIILNLLSNACKFTNPDGEISINISDRDMYIDISVKDTGIGIPKDKLDIIFERFGQVDKTLRRFHEGTGIGLSLVKSFVEMHGGKIDIISTVGEGTEFIICLPVKVLEDNKVNKPFGYEANIDRINIEFSDIYSDL